MGYFYALLVLVLALWGCTSINVQPVEASAQLRHVCIQENPKVQVSDFLPVLRDGFDRHGIPTEVFTGEQSNRCEYVLTYTALRSWDLKPYLSHAELRMEKSGRKVASAEYHLRGRGGWALTKFRGTRAKMDPVIDELLAAY